MFKKILVPIDMQRTGQAVEILKIANQLAEQFGSSLHVMTVMPGFGMPIVATYFPADAKSKARKILEEKLAALVVGKMSAKVTMSISEGKRADEILKVAKRRKSDLILIGSKMSDRLSDAILGSVGTKVAQRATASVMIVRL
jgi:universal stress protein F